MVSIVISGLSSRYLENEVGKKGLKLKMDKNVVPALFV